MATGALLPVWRYQAVYNGTPLPGAILRFYLSGTDTPAAVYADVSLSTSRGTSVTADSTGTFPVIYLAEQAYGVEMVTSAGVTVFARQNNVSSLGQLPSIAEFTRIGVGTAPDANNFITIPADASYGFKFGRTLMRNQSQSQIIFQGSGDANTCSLFVIPTTGTTPTDTITEIIVGRTTDQAFGGNYWRQSLTTSNSPNVDGLFLEMGGTQQSGGQMIRPWVFSIGVENPAGVFTSYEPFRMLSGSDTGNMGFGVGATSGRKVIQLEMASIGSAGTRSSHLISFRGKANDGTERAVDFRLQNVVTSNAGAGALAFSYDLNGGGASELARLTSVGVLAVGTTMTTSATAGAVVIPNDVNYRSVDGAGTNTIPLLRANSTDDVVLGGAARNVFIGYIAAASLRAGSAATNGIIDIDSTNNRFIYYSGGNRYYLAGTLF